MIPDTLDCRVLLGWMPRRQAAQFLLNECRMDSEMSIGQAEGLWRQYRTHVEELPARGDAPVRTFELDDADRKIESDFLQAHPEAADVSGLMRVHPLDLQVHQLQVVTDSSLELAAKVERDGWLKTAMPEGADKQPIRWRAEQSQLVFELPHPEFVLTAPAPPDAGMQIAPLPAWVSVARFEGRTLLVNGYHRTFAFINQKSEIQTSGGRENSLLFPVSNTLPFPNPPDSQTREVLLGTRSPRFADFFDRALALPVKLARNSHYEMRVQVEIVGVRAAKTSEKQHNRQAGA